MKFIKIAAIIIVLAVVWRVADTIRHAGEFKTLKPHFDGQCQKIEGVAGAEDITIHPQTGVAFISSNDRRALLAGEQAHGAIFAYDLKSSPPKLKNLTNALDHDFHPPQPLY